MSEASRRLGRGYRWTTLHADQLGGVRVGGRLYFDPQALDQYLASLPDPAATVRTIEAARLLGVRYAHSAIEILKGAGIESTIVSGVAGDECRWPTDQVLALARERDAELRRRDARRAKRDNAKRDRSAP